MEQHLKAGLSSVCITTHPPINRHSCGHLWCNLVVRAVYLEMIYTTAIAIGRLFQGWCRGWCSCARECCGVSAINQVGFCCNLSCHHHVNLAQGRQLLTSRDTRLAYTYSGRFLCSAALMKLSCTLLMTWELGGWEIHGGCAFARWLLCQKRHDERAWVEVLWNLKSWQVVFQRPWKVWRNTCNHY